MNKTEYYRNKIEYALNKIQYAMERMGGTSLPKNALPTLYYILAERESANISTLAKATAMSREDVITGLRKLKELGLADWEGTRLNVKKNIIAMKPTEKPDIKTWYADLMEKLEKTNLYQEETKSRECDEEIIEIELDEGMSLKVTKSRLKELVLSGLKKGVT
jgi:DNA-binding transcriptional regulator GbsR (MarR family)